MKYKFKGSPGPWKCVLDLGQIGGVFSIENDTTSPYIAETVGGLDGVKEAANASLLAAAPDLLESAINAINQIDALMEERNSWTDLEGVIQTLKNAIHKALNIRSYA